MLRCLMFVHFAGQPTFRLGNLHACACVHLRSCSLEESDVVGQNGQIYRGRVVRGKNPQLPYISPQGGKARLLAPPHSFMQ